VPRHRLPFWQSVAFFGQINDNPGGKNRARQWRNWGGISGETDDEIDVLLFPIFDILK